MGIVAGQSAALQSSLRDEAAQPPRSCWSATPVSQRLTALRAAEPQEIPMSQRLSARRRRSRRKFR
jgi:hypothetical protein